MNYNNSFAEATNKLIENVNFTLQSLTKLNETLTTSQDSVNVEGLRENPVTGEKETYTYSIPSYKHNIEQLSRISNAVDVFLEGKGTILLKDGTYREVKTIPIAKAPDEVKGLNTPQRFTVKPEWYTDDFLYPKMQVKFDLKDKISDRSDRVLIKKIIFDNFNDEETNWFKTNFVNTSETYTYYEATQMLEENGKNYWEDNETQFLPLSSNEFTGSFLIQGKETINGSTWFYFNTLNYKRVSNEPVPSDRELKINDRLRYGDNAIFKVADIVHEENRVKLVAIVGLVTPTEGTRFHIYSEPFTEKIAKLNVSYNECIITFFKGVNEDFNIISDYWGQSVAFHTNDLLLENQNNVSFGDYYYLNVFDLGRHFEGMAKDPTIPSYFGIKPDEPTLEPEQFRVTQVNKQINASLDTESIKNTQSQIENTKTIINSLRETIAQQKAELVEITDAARRNDLQNKINNNISELSKKTSEYQSYVKSLATIARENNVTEAEPKFRVRGFFDIPKAKRRTDNSNEDPQQVIQFEIQYRYLRLDDTGNPLETFTYTDPSTGQEITGTYTDWNSVRTPAREKVFDSSTGTYKWKSEVVSDGEVVNINQVDIPIRKGEKVQLRIRSLSEAGWPSNPVKSDWSNKVTIDFPADLSETNQVTNVLQDAQEEQTAIRLDETLAAEGVTSHLRDSMPNPNEGEEGTYFKHQSRFLAYNYSIKDTSTGDVNSERTISLQNYLDTLPSKSYVTVTSPEPGENDTKTVTLARALQKIMNQLDDPTAFWNSL